MVVSHQPAQTPIILIGPMFAGKSTVAELLAEKLDLSRRGLDELRWDYYEEIGYDRAEAKRIQESAGGAALLRYWKPFEAHAVERVVQEHGDCIIDFGAGHSVFEDPALFARVQRALAPIPNVVLILPEPDLDASVAILNTRLVAKLKEEGIEEIEPAILQANEHFTRHPSNFKLAKITVYTNGKLPEETADEIIARLATIH